MTNRDAAVVRDLKCGDFTVEDDGDPREVLTCDFITESTDEQV